MSYKNYAHSLKYPIIALNLSQSSSQVSVNFSNSWEVSLHKNNIVLFHYLEIHMKMNTSYFVFKQRQTVSRTDLSFKGFQFSIIFFYNFQD